MGWYKFTTISAEHSVLYHSYFSPLFGEYGYDWLLEFDETIVNGFHAYYNVLISTEVREKLGEEYLNKLQTVVRLKWQG